MEIGSSATVVVERLPVAERGQVDDRLHHGARLPARVRDPVVVAVRSVAILVDLASARLRQHGRVAVAQHDDRALDEAAAPGMAPLVGAEARLQRFVDEALDPVVHRRADADAAVDEGLHAHAFAPSRPELGEDVLHDRRRLRLDLAARGEADGGGLGVARHVREEESRCAP